MLARARADDLRRDARAARAARPPLPVRRPPVDEWVTLRFAFPDDAEALARLAMLDSAAPPAEPALLAEVGGELRAALSLVDGAVVADPFHHGGPLIELLRARARQLEGVPAGGRRTRLRGRLGLATSRD
jgi:hypothetical protein